MTQIPSMTFDEVKNTIFKSCGGGKTLRFHENPEAKFRLVFTPQGFSELCSAFHWGQEHPDNQYEQQARLLGHWFEDQHGRYVTVVCYVQPVYPVHRSYASAAIVDTSSLGDTCNVSMYRMLNSNLKYINECSPIARKRAGYRELDPFGEGNPVIVVGYAHTHPHMSCFASGTDRSSHAAAEGQPYVSLIVNPQAMELFAIAGYEMATASVLAFTGRYAELPSADKGKAGQNGEATCCEQENGMLVLRIPSLGCKVDFKKNRILIRHRSGKSKQQILRRLMRNPGAVLAAAAAVLAAFGIILRITSAK